MTKFILIIILILCSNSVQAVLKECQTPLELSITSNWYPFIYQDNSGVSTGFDIGLLRRILQQMGCQLKVVNFPERRLYNELKKGSFDIGLGSSKNSIREKIYFYSNPYRQEVNRFAYRVKDQNIFAVKNLQDILKLQKTIALNLGGWYGHEIEKAKIDNKLFIYSDSITKRVKMLNFNRVDIVVDDEVVLCNELLRSTFQGLKIHPIVLSHAPIHFIFNKNSVSPIFVHEFNKILDSMKENGSLTAHYLNITPVQCQRYN